MFQHISYGVIPILYSSTRPKQYLLLQNKGGYWGFPKGHPDKHETPEDTAVRELFEETGIVIPKEKLRSSISYEYEQSIDGTPQIKRIVLFPVRVDSKDVKVQPAEISRYEWATFDRAAELLGIPGIIEQLRRIEDSLV